MDTLPPPPGPVADEVRCQLTVHGEILGDLWCSPLDFEDLAVGHLLALGRIRDISEVVLVESDLLSEEPDEPAWVIQVQLLSSKDIQDERTSDSAAPSNGDGFSMKAIQEAARTIMEEAPLRKATGGIHSAGALLPSGEVIVREDVSRHCALDKAVGAVSRRLGSVRLLPSVVMLSSGRAAQEMVQKMVSVNALVFAARGIPTTPAYRLAHGAGLTLIGQVLDRRPIVYSGGDGIVATQE